MKIPETTLEKAFAVNGIERWKTDIGQSERKTEKEEWKIEIEIIGRGRKEEAMFRGAFIQIE